MAEVKWIKITTDIFSDEKMILIESLPEADSFIVIWFKLLTLAGHTNNGGVFLLTDQIAYDEKMFSAIFRRDEETIKKALDTFEKFGMIERIDGVITIPNWGKHQSIDQLETKREYQREYMRNYREKQKQTLRKTNSKTNSKYLRNTNVSALEIDKDIDIDKEEEKEKNIYIASEEATPAPKVKKHKFGKYKHVLLSDEDIEKLKQDIGEEMTNKTVVFLDEYIEMKGYKAKNHYLAIKKWVIDAVKEQDQKKRRTAEPINKKAQELDQFYEMAAEWAEGGET